MAVLTLTEHFEQLFRSAKLSASSHLNPTFCLYGIQVDASNIHSRMWPRAMAGAARAWSDSNFRDVEIAVPLMERARCSLLQRGIGAGPLQPDAPSTYCFLPTHIAERFDNMHWDAIRLRAQSVGRGSREAVSLSLSHHTLSESHANLSLAVRIWTFTVVIALGSLAVIATRGRSLLLLCDDKGRNARLKIGFRRPLATLPV